MKIKSSLKIVSFLDLELPEKNLESLTYKNVDFRIAKKNFPNFLIPALEEIESKLKREHKYISVDLKFHYLKKNEVPCIEGWHVDSEPNLKKDDVLENHFIYLIGNTSLTEFIDSNIDLEIPEDNFIKNYQDQLSDIKFKTIELEEKKIYNYSRFDFHRGNPASQEGWRILVRVSEQSKISPSRVWKSKPSFKRLSKETFERI